MVELFCDSFEQVPRRIVLDIDDTEDRVHGRQELALFHAHHDGRCFLPIHVDEAIGSKPVAVILRTHVGAPGTFTCSCPPHQTEHPAEGLLDAPATPLAAMAALLEGAVLQNDSRASMLAAFLCGGHFRFGIRLAVHQFRLISDPHTMRDLVS
jgi:hypothetical protein